ncbi:MAG: polymer-forming cytoskeletal protein [Pseudomonadota bacterium]
MSIGSGVLWIASDTRVTGKVQDCKRLEVAGSLEGELEAGTVVIHEGGQVYGDVKAEQAEVYGTMQGHIFIKNLIDIKESGSVSGDVKYGQLSLQSGAELEATLKNVPPELDGDFHLEVKRGESVKIKTADLTAIDPDDSADELTFKVSNPVRGFVALAGSPAMAVEKFTQADIESGQVMFVHDGSPLNDAFFDVVVFDNDNASSGDPQTLRVSISD